MFLGLHYGFFIGTQDIPLSPPHSLSSSPSALNLFYTYYSPFQFSPFQASFCPLMGLFPSVLAFRHSRCDYTQKTCTRLGSLAFHQEERHCVASTSPHRQLIFSGERGWYSYHTPKCSSRRYRQLTVVRREEGHEVPLLPDDAQAVGSCWGRGRYFLKDYSHQKGPRTL